MIVTSFLFQILDLVFFVANKKTDFDLIHSRTCDGDPACRMSLSIYICVYDYIVCLYDVPMQLHNVRYFHISGIVRNICERKISTVYMRG